MPPPRDRLPAPLTSQGRVGDPTRPARSTSVARADARTHDAAFRVELRAEPTGIRTFVLDTSVLLADPGALKRFDEHHIVLPVVVITELEGKRAHPELGY